MESAALLGGCCESGEVVEETFGVPWLWRFSSFPFLARVLGRFGETWAFLGMFRPIPAPKGVQTAQGLYHGMVAHFPLGVFPCPFRCPCGGHGCWPWGFCCAAKCPEWGNN